MNVEKISIHNYRLLKDTVITCEKELSLIVGKNNCGKTSLLSILYKCLGTKSETRNFEYYDFSTSFQKKLYDVIKKKEAFSENELKGIRLDIYITYNDNDNISNLSKLLLDLDPNNNTVVLRFEYIIDDYALDTLEKDFNKYKNAHTNMLADKAFTKFMQKKHRRYFSLKKYSVLYDYKTNNVDNKTFRLLDNKDVDFSKIISFNYINAQRDVSNTSEAELSTLSNIYYERTKNKDEDVATINNFENQIDETDKKFDEIYKDVFSKLINNISRFGGIRRDDTKIQIVSQMQSAKLLKDNTTVIYGDESNYLPEYYNGLGYLNLISMIIRIETVLSEIRKDNKQNESPADINIIFIEEPEVHTHPQMQYIFIKNIKELLNEGRNIGDSKIHLQTFITTHSSHIVAESDFDDLKYFVKEKRSDGYNITSKNLKDLEIAYQKEREKEKNHYKFLKQYLTLNRSEIFFADKIILIEGDTERILLPAMLKKLDQENNFDIPLLSQNISVIEVGNYSEIYSEFINFINIKTLIITDIDSNNKSDEACAVIDGISTSNSAIKFYLKNMLNKKCDNEIQCLTQLKMNDKILKHIQQKDGETDINVSQWISDPNGNLMITYQCGETNADNVMYNARSFEDAFFHLNKEMFTNVSGESKDEKINNCKTIFQSLNNVSYFFDNDKNYYELAQKCVKKKPSLAMDILLNSKSENGNDFVNWKIPQYIKEGLIWLQKD